MVTDSASSNRREWLARALVLGALPLAGGAWASGRVTGQAPPSKRGFAAAWETVQGEWRVGLLGSSQGVLSPVQSLDVPTRAHGLLWHGRDLIALARRPGDWLVRWPGAADGRHHAGNARWTWIEPGRAFNGHAILSASGAHVYTTETDLESGAGLIGVRDARSLQKEAEWPTRGMDPHELLLDADGSLLVANGGIPSLPESGRLKIGLERMDASLVRLDTRSGALIGQWRLADPRLSVRHLAWGGVAGQRLLGIALQAEHADAAQRRAAPVLALFDGHALRTAPAPMAVGGYGGAIAFADGRFVVSCPRADGVAVHATDGRWLGFEPLPQACALAASGTEVHAGGGAQMLTLGTAASRRPVADLKLDNHWLAPSSL